MITTIPIRITGDIWYNPREFCAELEKLQPNQYVLIDVNSEGPALSPFGIYEILAKYDHKYIFTKWSNPLEQSPCGRVACSEHSHFFKLSWRYWIDELPNLLAERAFGLFIGRNSVSRNCILYDVSQCWPDNFLLSKMRTSNNNQWDEHLPNDVVKIDSLKQWGNPARREKIRSWWDTCNIPSIDEKHVWDQYGAPEINAAKCASSLLSHYNQFNFELVCETYTLGTTFFPTEKTIRPIVGNKPFVVHGPRNFLKNLQNLGFKTFSGIWNEQYDNYESFERWKMMQPIIDMICNWDDVTRRNVLLQCSKITAHNRNRLKEIIDDNKRI
jgi:hypothetical protein